MCATCCSLYVIALPTELHVIALPTELDVIELPNAELLSPVAKHEAQWVVLYATDKVCCFRRLRLRDLRRSPPRCCFLLRVKARDGICCAVCANDNTSAETRGGTRGSPKKRV